MQMIDVIKRLAELDSKNPTMVKENQQVEECGIMPIQSTGIEGTSMPASINITAGSGEELSNMLATIMQLAGTKSQGGEETISADPVVALTAEPEMGRDSTADMRSMIDKLNPMGDDDVDMAHGDLDNDGDHDMDDHDMENDDEETHEGQYDNSPSDPRKPPPFGANDFAHHENQPGQGDRMDGTMPKATATMEQRLMAEYKNFVAEGNMPQSVIRSKQKCADMTDKEFHTAHKDKSEDELKAMAWRHGYGKGSNYYVNKHKKGQQGLEEGTSSTQHGSPFDRGSADSHYGRPFNPHYYANGNRRVGKADMTPDEIAAYSKGYEHNEAHGDRKDYGNDRDQEID